ncbi:MAG: transcription-repair coupling factor [Rickettsiales bacterium]
MPNQALHILPNTEGIVASNYLSNKLPTVVVAANNDELELVKNRIHFFNPSIQILALPAWDAIPYDIISPNILISAERLKTLANLADFTGVLVTTPECLMQKLIPQVALADLTIPIKKGMVFAQSDFIVKLVEYGFTRTNTSIVMGEFAVRGGIVDIMFEEDLGYRLDFFGSSIDNIRTFNPETQLSVGLIDHFKLIPVSEVALTPNSKDNFFARYRKSFGVTSSLITDSIDEGRKVGGIEQYIPMFYGGTSTLFDYLRDFTLIAGYDLPAQLLEFHKKAAHQFELRTNKNTSLILPLEQLYLDEEQVQQNLSRKKQFKINTFEPGEFQKVPNFAFLSKLEHKHSLELFSAYVQEHVDKTVVISCFTEGSRERLKKMLGESEITTHLIDQFKEVTRKTINLAVLPIEAGFGWKEYIFISEQDLLGERLTRKSKRAKKNIDIFAEFSNIERDDLLVHKEYGIGRFEGLETLEIKKHKHDFIKLTYKDNDKLYVPVENFELLTRYGTNDAELDKLGSLGWQSRKAKLKNRIKIAAAKIIALAAERSKHQALVLAPIDDMYKEFCANFPYVETDDQLKAIEETTHDLAQNKPMDRLVCGDVGFGKTEVALRAAAAALSADTHAQVALLVPTTLLARQHYATFQSRFQGMPVRIAQLSKFTKPGDTKKIKTALREGGVDIVIGTHALLAKDIAFKNLGLIIIDEEQHFGVGQKDRLKELRANAHVLTLSATPIPRTLQMSLFGLKDLSIIGTPPVDRMPIKTQIVPFDPVTLKEAILREFYRGGRVFFVSPRIQYLNDLHEFIKASIPEVKSVIAHGQMGSAELDRIMNQFYDGKYQVLISTSIVESGLDIPMANTIIVDRAEMFGLSQLYQIRGRVGRSNVQAYAYLTYPSGKRLTLESEKRLSILSTLDNLGAGFNVASHDMDMRGYGNLVGEEQSGQVKEVGVELYQEMLEQAVALLKNNEEQEDLKSWSPQLNIGITVQLPETYIIDSSLRLSLYRKIAAIYDLEILETFAAEMIDRFGSLPEEAENLFTIVKLKNLAKLANIEKIDFGDKGLVITFRNNQPHNFDKVIDLVTHNPLQYKLRGEQKLLIVTEVTSEKERLRLIENVTQLLI